jgi:fatty acid desaturase
MKINIDKHTLTHLSKPNIFISLFQICLEYMLIFSIIFLAANYLNPLTALLAIILIGARQQSLAAVAHDGVHYLVSKNKKLNDIVTNIFIYFPTFSSQKKYRTFHILHHVKTNSDDDPDYINKKDNIEYKFPQSRIVFFKNIFKYVFGVHYISMLCNTSKTWKQKFKYILKGFAGIRPLEKVKYKENKKELFATVSFNLALISLLVLTGNFWYYLLFWVCPFFLYIPFIFRIRSICEHFGIKKDKIDHSRTMYPNLFDRIFLGLNWNLTYHLDHHLFPSIPSYNVKKLHALLLQNRDYKDNAQITEHGSYGVFKECTL